MLGTIIFWFAAVVTFIGGPLSIFLVIRGVSGFALLGQMAGQDWVDTHLRKKDNTSKGRQTNARS